MDEEGEMEDEEVTKDLRSRSSRLRDEDAEVSTFSSMDLLVGFPAPWPALVQEQLGLVLLQGLLCVYCSSTGR